MEATQAAEDEWVAHVNEVAYKTLYPTAASWYMGANNPGQAAGCSCPISAACRCTGKTCNDVAANGYRGFALTPARQAATAAE